MYKVFCDLVPTNILSHFTHIVCKSSYLCHSADMFKKLEVLPLIHLVKYKTGCLYTMYSMTKSLLIFHHTSLILCCKSSYLCNSADLFKKLKVLPLFHLVKYKTAIFMYKVFYYLVPTNISSHFTHIVL